jgi:hypothetical protein
MLFLQISAANYADAENFIAAHRKAIRCILFWNLTVPSLAAQRRQPDAGGVEAAIDGEDLSRDVA